MGTIDTFIFDLDGTLLDTLPDLAVVTNRALEECGYPARTTEQILSYVGNGARALMCQAVPDGTDDAAVDRALSCWRRCHQAYGQDLTKPYDDIVETLQHLTQDGVKLGVLSNKFDAGARSVVESKLPGLFRVVHGECDDIPRKPDPTGLLRTIAELESTPDATAYIGDSPGDMLVAHAAGCLAVACSWGYRSVEDLQRAGYDVLLHSPRELLSVGIG